MSVSGPEAPSLLRDSRFPAGPFFPLDESKLHPPWARQGIVPRTALVERLLAPPATPVVCVVAPPGYGKTTVLAQWAARRGRVGWVGIDRHDNDPMVLLTYVAAALDRVETIDPEIVHGLASPGALPMTVVRRLAAALEVMSGPVVLVLDNLESLEDRPSLDVVAALAMQFSARPVAGSQLVLASRVRPPLPMGRLRALGGVVEVGVEELAMDQREAHELLEGAGVRLAEAEATALIRRTEGWPVGLYLAALSLKAGSPRSTEGVGFSGDDRFVADYLRSELLARLPPETVSFLTRTAMLDRLSGPLCDAVLDTGGSATVLESLAGSNLLLVPLDRRREWYRYHHLFGELLAAELVRREPELVPELHRRAAVWCEANGLPEAAVDHAQAAGDTDRVARLVAGLIQPTAAAGRVDTVRSWLEWFEDQRLVDRYPAVAVLGAMVHALWGQPATAERWADAAADGSFAGTLPDGSTMQSYWSLLRALWCRDGVDRMRADAKDCLAGLSPRGQLRAIALLLEGISYLLEGDGDRADPMLIRTVEVGTRAGALPAVSIALAERCLVAIGTSSLGRGSDPRRPGPHDRAAWAAGGLRPHHRGLCRPGPDGGAPGRGAAGPGAPRPSRPPAPAAHLRNAAARRSDAARAWPRLPRARRRRRCQANPAGGQRHPPPAARPRHPPRTGRKSCGPGSTRSTNGSSGRPRSPGPSCACSRCWPPTSPSGRLASACTSPRTR